MGTFNEELDQFKDDFKRRVENDQTNIELENQRKANFKSECDTFLKLNAYPILEQARESLKSAGHEATTEFSETPNGVSQKLVFTLVPMGNTVKYGHVDFALSGNENTKKITINETFRTNGGYRAGPGDQFTIAEMTPERIQKRLIAVIKSAV